MAEFTADFQSLRPSFPFLDIDPNLELISQFTGMMNNPLVLVDNSYLIPFSHKEPGDDFGGNFEGTNFPVLSAEENENQDSHQKRKATDAIVTETSSVNPTPAVSESGSKITISISGRGKRAKSNITEEGGKPKEVVHVRAKRGQATDSHSLAERVRRGKINEKIRRLQTIVPGCYKTMGMAVMLDEIINYVQSLQHQVEFLSMKLTAASSFYDFNSETDAMETMQRTRAFKARGLSSRNGSEEEGYGGGVSTGFNQTWPL